MTFMLHPPCSLSPNRTHDGTDRPAKHRRLIRETATRTAPSAARAPSSQCAAPATVPGTPATSLVPLPSHLFYGGLSLALWSLTSNLQDYQSDTERLGKSLGKICI